MREAAIGIVKDPVLKERILWIKRRDLPIWVLPGGGIDPGETAEQAVVREVLEETGLIVDIEKKAAVYHTTSSLASKTHLFICNVRSGTLKDSDETESLGYFAPDRQPQPAFPLHSDWLEDCLSPHEVKIDREMKGLTWSRIASFLIKHPFITLQYIYYRLMRK